MSPTPRRIALAALGMFSVAVAISAPALAFEPSEYDRLSRPIGFDGDRRDPIRPIGSTRADANNNRVFANGVSSLAAGNIIAVTIEGHGNTVKIDADQTNSGDIDSRMILNGRVFLNR